MDEAAMCTWNWEVDTRRVWVSYIKHHWTDSLGLRISRLQHRYSVSKQCVYAVAIIYCSLMKECLLPSLVNLQGPPPIGALSWDDGRARSIKVYFWRVPISQFCLQCAKINNWHVLTNIGRPVIVSIATKWGGRDEKVRSRHRSADNPSRNSCRCIVCSRDTKQNVSTLLEWLTE